MALVQVLNTTTCSMQQPSAADGAQPAGQTQPGTRYPAFTRPVPFPAELLSVRQSVQAYVNARIRQFGGAFAQVLNLQMDDAQLEDAIAKSVASLGSKEVSPSRTLRLVLRHDCMSTGCGEPSCLLCQFNPSRLCRRNLKNKYLIDDHIKAKCNAPLRVELVDESGACVLEGLPPGMQLEVHVLNGEKYREICPDNVLLSHQQLRACIISNHTKALLRRENGSDDQLRCFLQLEVATKRVKHAIKSDIPSITDSVSKLVHIGKATVEKLHNLRQAASEEGFAIQGEACMTLPCWVKCCNDIRPRVEMHAFFREDLVRHLLKLSPEKWEEVAQHAQGAVMPDFRPRAWWCPSLRAGLLFGTKNGAVCMDQPIALVKMGASAGGEDGVVPSFVPVFHALTLLVHCLLHHAHSAGEDGRLCRGGRWGGPLFCSRLSRPHAASALSVAPCTQRW
ncbi:hypothetical protein DUNSADRAFT_12024 [Dunaliella salina]|uniref:Uncharacterized protein n=1 Tax=Dunaliella salina TaxID=3046 RepID=A0ABQ7GC51_DUNSA|nr:hypothetical protein DUNSADRAFT_12024 [Dunaliella salina]|eukprot:KAF5832185.1 hypothetical protein DUNSADRAFT_12024 [Dunaliella salina]